MHRFVSRKDLPLTALAVAAWLVVALPAATAQAPDAFHPNPRLCHALCRARCSGGSIAHEYAASELVFQGWVAHVAGKKLTFVVTQRWKGNVHVGQHVDVEWAAWNCRTDCYFQPVPSTSTHQVRYVVFVRRHDGHLAIPLCTNASVGRWLAGQVSRIAASPP